MEKQKTAAALRAAYADLYLAGVFWGLAEQAEAKRKANMAHHTAP